MAGKDLDALDREIMRLLTENGRMPIVALAKQLNITAPTVRYRLKAIEETGLFKVAGVVDPDKHPGMITAIVAMSVQSEGELDQILDRVSRLPNVVWAGVVAGRYDILAEVVCIGGRQELYEFTTRTILSIANVVRSETFLIMKSRENWLRLPEEVAATGRGPERCGGGEPQASLGQSGCLARPASGKQRRRGEGQGSGKGGRR